MNILIISESFLKGGLETYIFTMYEELKKQNNVYFAFGNIQSDIKIPQKLVCEGFNFSFNSTIKNFIEDVEKLVEIIKKKKINLIMVNPFFSFFPAVFASQITNTKIVYVYHGRGSLNFPSSMVDTILFRYSFESIISKVFCVSEQGVSAFKTINYNDSIFLPNPIDEKKFQKTKYLNNKKWAIISRLDEDKIPDIIKFLKLFPDLEIDHIDIFGDGNQRNILLNYISANKLNSKIILRGYTADIYEKIKDNYTGIIGVGRVAIEGLSMNYPVFLIGYNKVVGVIDKKIYDDVKKYNFVPNYCDELSKEAIQQQIRMINKNQLSKFQFRENIIEDFGVVSIVKQFTKSVENIESHQIQNFLNFYFDLKTMDDDQKKSSFYYSDAVYYLLEKNLAPFTNDYNLKTIFTIFNFLLKKDAKVDDIKNITDKEIVNINDFISKEIENVDLRIKSIENTIEKNTNSFSDFNDEIMKRINILEEEKLKINKNIGELLKNNNLKNELITDLYESTSWKITKPFRIIKSFINKIILKLKRRKK